MRGRIRARLWPLAVLLLLLPTLALGESGGVPPQVAESSEQEAFDALDGKPPGDPGDLPLLPSDDLVEPERTVPQTDFRDAPGIDRLLADRERDARHAPDVERVSAQELTVERGSELDPQDAGREIEALDVSTTKVLERRKTYTTYERPDGSRTTRFYTDQVNFKDGDGDWREIDPALVSTENGFRAKATPAQIEFASTTDEWQSVRVSDDGWSISFGLEGAEGGREAAVAQNELTYSGVEADTDLRYTVGLNWLKEEIVLHEAPTAESLTYRFPIAVDGLMVSEDASGIVFRDAGEQIVARMPHGLMVDSAARGDASEAPIDVRLEDVDGAPAAVIAPDMEWLTSPDRAYPISLDPGLWLPGASEDTYTASGPGNYGWEQHWYSEQNEVPRVS